MDRNANNASPSGGNSQQGRNTSSPLSGADSNSNSNNSNSSTTNSNSGTGNSAGQGGAVGGGMPSASASGGGPSVTNQNTTTVTVSVHNMDIDGGSISSASASSQATSSSSSVTMGQQQQSIVSGSAVKESSSSVELHPRKRKIRASRDEAKGGGNGSNATGGVNNSGQGQTGGSGNLVSTGGSGHGSGGSSNANNNQQSSENEEGVEGEVHPHDQPITNCYKMFLDIRKQIERRQKSLVLVQPKPPQGFKDYLMNRKSYILAGKTSADPPKTQPPVSVSQQSLKDLYVTQDRERHRLKMRHVVEKEKLVLSVEQEILRVHGRAARAVANQSLPFSVCTILKDEEVYNILTPEQEEKDRNDRSRYNGRLFMKWLQDVDDKWDKIKVRMRRKEDYVLHFI